MNKIQEKMTNYRKVNWKEIFPTYNRIVAELDFYKSTIDISKFNGKQYVDLIYGHTEPFAKINYIVLNGEWEMDEFVEDDKHKLKIIDAKSGQSIEFAFNSFSDKISFINEIYSNKPVKQVNAGMNIEKIVNSKLINKSIKWLSVITLIGIVKFFFFLKKRNRTIYI